MAEYIYIAKNESLRENLYKIGYSNDPDVRVKSIGIATPPRPSKCFNSSLKNLNHSIWTMWTVLFLKPLVIH